MVEIIPKSEVQHALWRNIGNLALAVLIAAIAGFVVLSYAKGVTRRSIAQTQQKLQLESAEKILLQKKVTGYENRIRDLKTILPSRKEPLAFLSFLETNTHTQVVFTDIVLSPAASLMVLSGKAADFGVVQEQLLIFQQDARVLPRLVDLGIGKEGEVRFKLELAFSNL